MAAKIAISCKQLRPVKFPLRSLVLRTFYSSKSLENMGKITSFSNPEVQSLLKKLTGRNLDKIYAMRRGEFEVPSYKLMTDAEYLEVIFCLFLSDLFSKWSKRADHVYMSRHAHMYENLEFIIVFVYTRYNIEMKKKPKLCLKCHQ